TAPYISIDKEKATQFLLSSYSKENNRLMNNTEQMSMFSPELNLFNPTGEDVMKCLSGQM
ncbi:MAG: hypothetical protein RR253_08040, partial [Oscillospiraceae bacterium]